MTDEQAAEMLATLKDIRTFLAQLLAEQTALVSQLRILTGTIQHGRSR